MQGAPGNGSMRLQRWHSKPIAGAAAGPRANADGDQDCFHPENECMVRLEVMRSGFSVRQFLLALPFFCNPVTIEKRQVGKAPAYLVQFLVCRPSCHTPEQFAADRRVCGCSCPRPGTTCNESSWPSELCGRTVDPARPRWSAAWPPRSSGIPGCLARTPAGCDTALALNHIGLT